MENKTFKLDELAQLTGVTVRTIRFYIQKGLLGRPEGEGRGSHYTADHLGRLLEIKKFTAAGVALERIHDILSGAESPVPPRPRAPGSVEVRSHVFLAPGVELQINPAEALWPPEKIRALAREAAALAKKIFEE